MAGDSPRVGVVGLGPMGLPMAQALAEAGFGVVAWNRTSSAVDTLAARVAPRSVVGASTPAEVAAQCRVVIAMLPDLPHLLDRLDGPDGLRAGWSGVEASGPAEPPLLVVMSTVSPVAVADAAADLAREGIHLIDAPVSGGVIGAEERRLSIMVGGAAEDVVRVWPLFEAMGGTIEHLGPVGSGALAKACNQVVVAGSLVAISEALTLARAGGLDLAQLVRLFTSGLAGSELLNQKADRFLTRDFEGGGSARNQVKDLDFVLAAGRRLGVEQPVSNLTRTMFVRLLDQGGGDLDHTAVIRAFGPPGTDGRRR
ncbi:MAG: NAD(P)-dependent oxidoreductase [Propioniciclava sp.]